MSREIDGVQSNPSNNESPMLLFSFCRVGRYRKYQLFLGALVFVLLFFAVDVLGFYSSPRLSRPTNVLTSWNRVVLQAVREARMGAPIAGRALATVDTCVYDAWAAYDEKALGTQLSGAIRRPAAERTQADKEKAISYAAYRALSDVLSVNTESVYKPLMKQFGYDPDTKSVDIETPEGIGNVACAAVLEFRHHDKSNQLGDMQIAAEENAASTGMKIDPIGAYSDWSGYRPVNAPATVPVHFPFVKPVNPDHWQPLTYTDSTGSLAVQMFSGAQWCFVTPFALAKGEELRSAIEPGPAKYGTPEYEKQAQELIDLSASLTDRQKVIVEYWSEGPNGDPSIENWLRFAEFISARDHHTLDDDVKMYFALSNAMFDAGIAAWDAKRAYDSPRPITTIALLFKDKKIRAWGGPGKGTVEMDGSHWIPYQLATFPSPPSPEYVSGQSTYGAAAARILELWSGSGRFGQSVELPAGSSKIEPGVTPSKPVVLKWETFSDAANEEGMAGRYGGIQFERADLAGRKLGRLVADKAWCKARFYFNGTVAPAAPAATSTN